MNATAAMKVNGIFDLFSFWRDGTIGDALALFDAIKAKDWNKVRTLAKSLAVRFGVGADAKEIDEFIAECIEADWGGALSELADELKLIGERFRKTPLPAPVITTLAVPHIDEWTGTMARTWLADNRSNVRGAGKHLVVRFKLRNAPELTKLMAGDATAGDLAGIDPERLAKIIEICRFAIPILTIAGAVFPPCLIAATVLKFIVAWYDANHPTSADAVNQADKGLAPTDFLVAA